MAKILYVSYYYPREGGHTDALMQLGHEIYAVGNLQSALEHATKDEYDIGIIDLHLPAEGVTLPEDTPPQKSGLYLVQRIRQLGMKMPIITTGLFRRRNILEECIEAGAQEYLAKIFDTETLVEAVNKQLNV